ncbi:MAG TPA: gas vesicle protein GvpG [Terriglobales bacterium]|nr:gas vesicle protein GvpG [Terriglobales bacterium]
MAPLPERRPMGIISMLLLDDLLLSPLSGFKFILRTLQRVAEQEYTDDTPLKERLLELQLKLEEGQISEEEYVAEEAGIIRELRELQKRKRELAGLPAEEGPISMDHR